MVEDGSGWLREDGEMANRLTASKRAEAEILLKECRDAQTLLWDKSLELEVIIGCAVDTTDDLESYSLSDIMRANKPI